MRESVGLGFSHSLGQRWIGVVNEAFCQLEVRASDDTKASLD